MANNITQGLFQGASLGDIRNLMGQERDARVRQSMMNVSQAGGGFQAAMAAKARQQGNEALSMGFRGLGNKMGAEFAEDPRLTKARKMEADKKFILEEIGKFTSDGSGISQEEMRTGYALLMQRGYPNEARQFLKDAQNEREMDIASAKVTASGKTTKAKEASTNLAREKFEWKKKNPGGDVFESGTFKDKNGTYQVLTYTSPDGKSVENIVPLLGSPEHNRETGGEPIPTDSKGMTSKGRTGEIDAAKWNEERSVMVSEGFKAMESLRGANRALELAKGLKTGGLTTQIKQGFLDFFGKTPADVGEFNALTSKWLTEQLALFGRNPTNEERKYLEAALAGLRQSKDVNVRLLENAVNTLKRISDRTGQMISDPSIGATRAGYEKFRNKGWEEYKEQLENGKKVITLPNGIVIK